MTQTSEPPGGVCQDRPQRRRTRFSTDRYVDAAFARREHERLWLDVWQVVCRQDQVASPGAYVEYTIGDQPFVMIRGHDSVLRAFHNVCPHRGNKLCVGSGSVGPSGALVCSYHLWSFELDGTLRQVTDRETFAELDQDALALTPASVDVWGGFVFMHPKAEPPMTLAEYLGDVPAVLAPYHLEQMVPSGLNLKLAVAGNWKQQIEANSEAYHVQGIHPQALPLSDDYNVERTFHSPHMRMHVRILEPSPRLGVVDPDETLDALLEVTEVAYSHDSDGDASVGAAFERYRDRDGRLHLPDDVSIRSLVIEMTRAAHISRGLDITGLEPWQMVDSDVINIFPNLSLAMRAGECVMFRSHPVWGDPGRSTVDIVNLKWFPPGEAREAARTPQEVRPPGGLTGVPLFDQDLLQFGRVQEGLRSTALREVIFSDVQEEALAHFHEWLDFYVSGRASHRPVEPPLPARTNDRGPVDV